MPEGPLPRTLFRKPKRAFGYLYLSGANLSECLIAGKVAGHKAADFQSWD
jgi:hypothetical protein